MHLDFSKKIILTVMILSLAALLIIFGVFLPVINYIKKTNDDSYKLRTFLEQRYEQSRKSKITRKKMDEIRDSFVDFIPFLYKKGDDLKLITYLEGLAAKHKLAQSISNSMLDQIAGNQIAIGLNLSGEYKHVFEYMTNLESSDYFINIEELQLTPIFERNIGLSNSVNLYLAIKLYV